MRLLLDTHVWYWSRMLPERLSSRVARCLRDQKNELWLSPISVWEMMLLVEKGRITPHGDFSPWIASALREIPLNEASLTTEIVLQARGVASTYRDPADRFLIATAQVLDCTLVTADEMLIEGQPCKILAND